MEVRWTARVENPVAWTLLKVLVLIFCALIGVTDPAVAEQLGCGERRLGEFGPFDYRDPTAYAQYIKRVESNHFGRDIETLSPSVHNSKIGGDLDFVLRYAPNHHRALLTMVKYARKTKSAHPPGMRFSVDCWFSRARAMAADDAKVPLIYGVYLMQSGRNQEAVKEFELAEQLSSGNDPNLLYNLGLAYAGVKRYEDARKMARKAYALGHPLPGLRNLLKRAGQWKEP